MFVRITDKIFPVTGPLRRPLDPKMEVLEPPLTGTDAGTDVDADAGVDAGTELWRGSMP